MPNPNYHPECPRCHGEGFYLAYEGQGYMRDGSFEHNQWKDCTCDPYMDTDDLPRSLYPPHYNFMQHPYRSDVWVWWKITKGKATKPERVYQIGLDGVS